MMTTLNESLMIVAAVANYLTFASLLCFKKDPNSLRKKHIALLAWAVGSLVVMSGTSALRMVLEGGFVDTVSAPLYASVSVVVCRYVIKHGGNIAHALRGSSNV